MAIPNHPMAGLKGTPEAKAMMAQVSAHRGGGQKAPAQRDQQTRAKQAQSGAAMGDGSYPIENQTQLTDAVSDWVRTGRSLAVKAHIVKRAGALNLPVPAGLSPAKATDELDVARQFASRTK